MAPSVQGHRRGSLLSNVSATLSSSSPADAALSSPAARVSRRRQQRPRVPQLGPNSEGCSPHTASPQRLELSHAPPMANGVPLVNPREAIPDRFRAVFPYALFNMVQSKCFTAVYKTSDNVVVSAPTGSGKTALLELAICKLACEEHSDNTKIIYIAPTKALCKEKAEQWTQTFGVMAMPISELTGDTSRTEMKNVREAKIIVTTPEKWDSITRSWSDHRRLLDLIGLFLIDEVHILRESRGATLEAIVSRMKTYGAKVRFIALSATIPNSEDVATWLGRNHACTHEPARREVFGEECRPVKLQKFVYGFDSKMPDYPFDSFLKGQLWKHIGMHSQNTPLLIFCMTRKSCHDAAEELAQEWSQRQPSARLWPEPIKRIPVLDAKLQQLVQSGVAFHHAGLDLDDRIAVQRGFEQGALSVICCTSTLAVGINLPCHTVVLKGTVGYQDGQLCEYSDLEIMQMLGRAGRPQFGTSAVAIILTRFRNKKRYEDLASGQQTLESTLHKNLIEHLNSESSLGTFQTLGEATTWLNSTFLSVRLRRNPRYYSTLTEANAVTSTLSASTEGRLEQICEMTIEKLRDSCLINGSPAFQPTEYGRAMSKYMIRFDTMKKILELPRGAQTKDLLSTLCKAGEFSEFRWQDGERELFRELNKSPFILYPIEGNVATVAQKIFLLVQVEIGHVDMANITGRMRQNIRTETRRVLEVMHRLVRAVIECKGADMDGPACWAALELARSMTARAWEGKSVQLLQVPQVGPVLMRKLVASNIGTVAELANADTSTIERIASRNPPFGKKMAESLALFPRLVITAKVKRTTTSAEGRSLIHVDAALAFISARGQWQGKIPIVTFIAVTSGGVSAYFWRASLKTFTAENHNTCLVRFTWEPECAGERIVCRFACEEIVGTVVSADLGHNLPARALAPRPRKSASPTPRPDSTRSLHHSLDGDISDDEILGLVSTAAQTKRQRLDAGPEEGAYPMMDRHGKFMEVARSSMDISQPRSSQAEDVLALHDTIRLPNGRYRCGHPCSQAGGGKTARGHDCGHDCCRNGSKHPPRKSGGRKRVPDDDVGKVEPIPSSNPPAKRVKATNDLKSGVKTTASIARRTAHHRKPAIDLSAYAIDEEGLIDLTKDDALSDDDDLLRDFMNGTKRNTVVPANSSTTQPVSTKATNADSMLDDLSDRDFTDVISDEWSGGGDSLPQNYIKSDDYSGGCITGLMLEEPHNDPGHVQEAGSHQGCRNENNGSAKVESSRQYQISRSGVNRRPVPEPFLSPKTPFTETNDRGQPKVSVLQPRMASSESKEKEPNEPEWVKELDADLIDEFRDLVDFI